MAGPREFVLEVLFRQGCPIGGFEQVISLLDYSLIGADAQLPKTLQHVLRVTFHPTFAGCCSVGVDVSAIAFEHRIAEGLSPSAFGVFVIPEPRESPDHGHTAIWRDVNIAFMRHSDSFPAIGF